MGHKSILITGASGYLGFNVLRKIFYLYPNYDIIGIDKNNERIKLLDDNILNSSRFKFYHNNINDTKLLQKILHNHHVRIVIIHGSPTGWTPQTDSQYIKNTINTTYNTLNECKKYGKIKHIIYGNSVVTSQVTDDIMTNNEPYLLNLKFKDYKTQSLVTVYNFKYLYNMPITICHMPIIYGGKYDHPQNNVPTFINNLINDEQIILDNSNSHTGYDCYLYMSDLVKAFHKIIKIGYNTKQYEFIKK